MKVIVLSNDHLDVVECNQENLKALADIMVRDGNIEDYPEEGLEEYLLEQLCVNGRGSEYYILEVQKKFWWLN